jgi:MYXO-CTERM domain-containing protein
MTGECAPTQRRGRVSATWSGDAPTPEFAGMLAYRLKVDGEAAGYRYGAPAGHSAEAAFCGNIEVVSLADGSSAASPEVCFGDSPPDPLGLHEVDPLLELGACAEGAYTCSIVPGDFGEEWDPDACQAWPDSGGTAGESESGTTGESGTAGESGDASSSDSSGDDSSGKTSSATAGEDDPPEGGCACAVAPGDPGLGLGLGLLALLGLRRRGD